MMKLKFWFFMVGSFLINLATASTVVIDTGHTPAHPGATAASGRVEYEFNKAMAQAVQNALKKSNIKVVPSAVDGEDISLTDRTARAPAADLFVSIHHDSMQQNWIDAGLSNKLSGYAVFVSKKNMDFARSLTCAKSVATQLQRVSEKPSLYHATPIKGENRPLLDAQLGVHQFDDLIVLKTARMPAILIEIGVIVNPEEEKRLAKPDIIQRDAKAIAAGIVKCLSH